MTSKDERDAAEELHAHRHDSGEWSDEPVPIEVRPTRSEVVSFRLPSNELDELVTAATAVGESLSEFIRGALAIRVHGTPIGPTVEITSQGGSLLVRSHIVTSSRSEAPYSFVPEFPPLTSSVTGT